MDPITAGCAKSKWGKTILDGECRYHLKISKGYFENDTISLQLGYAVLKICTHWNELSQSVWACGGDQLLAVHWIPSLSKMPESLHLLLMTRIVTHCQFNTSLPLNSHMFRASGDGFNHPLSFPCWVVASHEMLAGKPGPLRKLKGSLMFRILYLRIPPTQSHWEGLLSDMYSATTLRGDSELVEALKGRDWFIIWMKSCFHDLLLNFV